MSGQLHARAALPRYPMDRRLGGSQSRSRRNGEEKNLLPLPGIELRPSSPPLYQLRVFDVIKGKWTNSPEYLCCGLTSSVLSASARRSSNRSSIDGSSPQITYSSPWGLSLTGLIRPCGQHYPGTPWFISRVSDRQFCGFSWNSSVPPHTDVPHIRSQPLPSTFPTHH
jgi:hypothetical protein